jgi:hypothetical protein
MQIAGRLCSKTVVSDTPFGHQVESWLELHKKATVVQAPYAYSQSLYQSNERLEGTCKVNCITAYCKDGMQQNSTHMARLEGTIWPCCVVTHEHLVLPMYFCSYVRIRT